MNIIYSYFVLDIIHKGHLMFLKNSKAVAGPGGRLIVGIVSDESVLEKKGRAPIFNFSERLELATSIKYIDLVVAQESYSPSENVKNIRPDVLMESESHNHSQIEESRKLMKKLGGKVIVLPYLKNQSSSLIKEKIMSN